MKSITNITGSNSNTNLTLIPSQRVSILDHTNVSFLRLIQLRDDALIISRGQNQVAFPVSELIQAAVNRDPSNLTWAPNITNQPINVSVNSPNATSFIIIATAETAISYQWSNSSDNGGNWANLAAAGVYANVTTNHLNISNSNTLNGSLYRCQAYNPAGASNSNAAKITVL